MRYVVLSVVALTVLLSGRGARANPQSWLRFGAAVRGSDVTGRFGAEVACSRGLLNSGHGSIVAVGAPNAADGEGRVYLYDPLHVSSPLQVLDPAISNVAKRFGTAIEFIDDINGDGVDDLLVGAPGTYADTEGRLYAFTSLVDSLFLNNGVVRYTLCGGVGGSVGFAQKVQGLRAGGGASGSNVVVANPRSGRLDSFLVFSDERGGCQFEGTLDFSEVGSPTSEFGASLTQVGSSAQSALSGAGIVVTAPGEGSIGRIYERRFAASLVASGSERGGSVGSGRYDSATYVVGVPKSDSNRGTAVVYGADALGGTELCALSNPLADLSGTFGSNVHHLGGSFLDYFGAAREVVVVRSPEISTGGALSLVGVMEGGCIAPITVNNCQQDMLQEQGVALAGGVDCQASINGRVQHLLVSGSPGWSGGQGRVDIAFEEGILDVPLSCPEDEGTAPLAVTSTPLPMETEVYLVIPTVTPTATYTWTSEPEIPATASVTPTSYPIASDDLDVATPVADRDESQGTASYQSPTATPQSPVPVVVAPGSAGLPAPEVIVRAGQVEVLMPAVKPQLSSQQQIKAIRHLQKKRGLSRRKAAQSLGDPDNLTVTYILHYTEVTAPRRFALIQSAYAEGSTRRTDKVRQIRTRLNSITLRNLRPGATFKVWYTVEVSTKKPRVVLGVTQRSATASF